MAIQRCDSVINGVFYSWQKKKRKETQTWEDSAKKSLEESARYSSTETICFRCASSWTATGHKEEYVMIYFGFGLLIFLLGCF